MIHTTKQNVLLKCRNSQKAKAKWKHNNEIGDLFCPKLGGLGSEFMPVIQSGRFEYQAGNNITQVGHYGNRR